MARVLLCILLFVYSLYAAAQDYNRFLHYTLRDGLSQNSVHCIFQDKDGLIWIGTQDGLNSFDGKKFNVYRHDDNDSNTISDQFVLTIKEDREGYLWIGTRNGLNRFSKRTGLFERFYVRPNEKHFFQAAYFNFFVMADGNIGIPGNASLYILNPRNKEISSLEVPGNERISWHVNEQYEGWAFLNNGVYNHYPDVRKPFYTRHPSKLSWGKDGSNIFQSYHTATGIIYFLRKGKKEKIISFNSNTGTWGEKTAVPASVAHLATGPKDELYASTRNGLYIPDNNNGYTLLRNDPAKEFGLPTSNLLCSYMDKDGNLWVGTAGNGILVSNRVFSNFLLIKTPVTNDVVNTAMYHEGYIYMGSASGLFVLRDNESNNYPITNRFFTNKRICALTVDHSGRLWVGIENEGIWVADKNGSVIKKFPHQHTLFEPAIIHQLVTDSRGRVLVCCDNNFYVIPGINEPWIKFTATGSNKLSGNYVMHALEDRSGNIWLSNNKGLDVFSPNLSPVRSFRSHSDTSSPIKRTIITSSTQDKNGDIWISTIRNGVYHYANNAFKHYTSSDGLNSDVVYNLICDDSNRIWATTSNGLAIFDRKHESFTSGTPLDGIPNTAFIQDAVAPMPGGRILFGTSDGLLICKASLVTLQGSAITASLQDIRINGRSVDLSNQSLSLIADNKTVSFQFTASPEFFTGNIIYQYRLLGAGEQWITLPQGIRTVTYNGLPYHELKMQVRAATSVNGLGSAKISSINIYSRAPFWKTGWFIAIAVLLIIVVVAMLVLRYNKRKYRKQLSIIEREKELQAERQRIGRDLHDNIGAYTSALIAGLNQVRPSDHTQEKHIDDLKEYAVNIMSFLRETIWMLNSQSLTITAFADRFKNYALRIGKNYPDVELNISEAITENKTLPPGVMLNLFRILQEALQNAYRHAHATEISIRFASNGKIIFEVGDNGNGFSESLNKETYGLSNMRQRAEETGFLLTLISEKDAGTTVRVTENTAYAAAERSA